REFADLARSAAPIADYALLYHADSLARLGDAANARLLAQQIPDQWPDSRAVSAALILAAEQASRAGDEAGAAALWRRVLDRFPDLPDLPRARLAWAQALSNAGRLGEAAAAYRELWLLLPASPQGEAAARELRALEGRGVALAAGSAPKSAEPAYVKLTHSHPESDEGLAATWRLGWLSWLRGDYGEAIERWSRIASVRAASQGYRDASAYWIGRAHAELGQTEAATRQFAQLIAEAPRSYYGILASRRAPPAPRTFWDLFYPMGWRNELTDAASRAVLDPYLVAAIVREESSFYPQARSRVGARGLMQLMPATARPLARSRGLPTSEESLDDPAVNLVLGSAYLGVLMKEFGEPRLAVAAYNAGPTSVREWWKSRPTEDLEAWVELIPYDETRRFVRRVMLAWEEYRRRYA